MTTINIAGEIAYTRYSEIPAWDESYTILPGAYETYRREYHHGFPFDAIKARVRVVFAKKSVLWGGAPVRGTSDGPDAGDILEIEIPVSKLPNAVRA